MSTLNRIIELKKKDFDPGSTLERIQKSRREESKQIVTPQAEKTPTFFDRLKSFGTGASKTFLRTGVAVANMFTGTLDFAADYLANAVEKQTRRPSLQAGLLNIPLGKETEARKKAADRWKRFYESTGGQVTEKMKHFTQALGGADYIQPTEKWQKASTRERFSKEHIGETALIVGPGVLSSWGMYAINPTLGAGTAFGSVADDVKTVAIENGVNEDRAEILALATAVPVMFLDKAVPDDVFSPAQKKAFIGGFVKRVVRAGLKETATEVTQEAVQLLAEATVRQDITKDEVIFRNLIAGLSGLMGGVGAQSTVSFINGIKSGDVAPPEVSEVRQERKRIEIEKAAPPERMIQEQPVARAKPEKVVEVKKPPVKKPVVVAKPKAREVTEKQIKTTKNIKDTKTTLRRIRTELDEAVAEAEGKSIVAQSQREGINTKDVARLKRIYSQNSKFQEGDIETIRASKHQELVNSVVENIQEANPNITSDEEALQYALDLPTKADESATTPRITELRKQEKKISKYLDLLRSRQSELNLQEDKALSKEWERALAAQKKLQKIVKVPRKQLPVGQGKERVSRLEARLKGALEGASEEDIEELGLSKYRQMNQEEQIAGAVEYVRNNPEDALRVVNGEIDPPEGLLQNSIYAALVELGQEDTDLATKVASLSATRFGQEINILKKIMADNPVVMMQDIVQARIEAYEKKTGKKANARIKSEVEKIKKEIKAPTRQDWDGFLDSIKC